MRPLEFARDSFAPTFFGWTPGLRTLVGGRVLTCGCLTGTYTTWRGRSVVILDARGYRCAHAHHQANLVLWRKAGARDQPCLDEAPFADLA